MSRPRSRSPRYRRFSWEEPDLNSHHHGSKLDGHQPDRNNPEEFREYFNEELHSGGQRRPPPRSEDRSFGRPHHPIQEFRHRRSSPHRDDGCYKQRRFTPPCDVWRGVDRRREDFRPRPQTFENKGQSSQSPVRTSREGPPPMARPHSDHHQREPGNWRREERGRGRFRGFSSDGRSDHDQGRRSSQGSPHQNRNFPPFKWHKRNMDGEQQAGFMDDEDFGGQGYSVETSRGGFGQSTWGGPPRGHARQSGTVFNHSRIKSWEPLRRQEQFDDDRDVDPGFGGRRSPRPHQERPRDDPRGRRFHEPRRSPPASQDRPSPGRVVHRGGAFNNRGRSTFRPMRNWHSSYRGARTGPTSTPPRFQQSSQEHQDLPEEEQRGHRPHLKDPKEDEDSWPEEDRRQPWDKGRNLDPKMPRQRRFNQLKSENMAAKTEETLIIKVDMSQPAQHNRQEVLLKDCMLLRNRPHGALWTGTKHSDPKLKNLLSYSSDRQLSLDLVNVGRQRLDFLPMLEHSGSYRETAMHTGTFAQEIITLVHQVKDQYFRGDQLTLNQRFSASQSSSCSVEGGGLTLDQRFKPNRGSTQNTGALLDADETLFSSLGPPQNLSQPPVRGPGDLRHDLERRRQEKLEGVKVTIPGQSAPQRTLAAIREPKEEEEEQKQQQQQEEEEEEDEESSCRMKHDFEGVSDWMEEQSMKTEGRMGVRRGGAPSRPTPVFHRRNESLTNRRTNFQSGSTGPDW